jgi:prepilin-type N-terminal cleavage/methylation domain-containing protein
MKRTSPTHLKAFTLIELLVVITIISILLVVMTLGLRGISESGKFNQSLNNIAGILEQSRAYARAQDTYVWVVLYQGAPSSGPLDVYVGAFASNDGTDPLDWSGSVALPNPGTVGSTTLSPLTRPYHLKGLRLQTTTLPNAPSSPNLPATTPNFQYTVPSDSGSITVTSTNAVYWVIQFAPNGMAHNSANPISSIWLGLQPAYSSSVFDQHNIASIEVNGLTGLSTIYRQ